ncbi:MAG: hypothetical protein R3F17_14100 [Planctomycetota bacterium]
MLEMADGRVAVGHLIDHDSNGLRFRVARTGGVVQVPWTLLHPGQGDALQRRFGYIQEQSEEMLITVEKLVLASGQEVVGVILERGSGGFVIKSEGNTQVVPNSRVVSVVPGGLRPALDVYQVEELYNMGRAQLVEEDPDSQVELARYCERILDFTHAVLHYSQAIALGKDRDTAEWQAALNQATEKAKQADQLERLHEADRLRRRNLFPQALEKIAAFRATYPKSPLLAEAAKAEALVLKTQARTVAERIQDRWFQRMSRLTRELAREPDADFDSLVARIESQMTAQIRQAVTADVESLSPGIQPEVVEEMFRQRKLGRFRSATYGSQTWLLGSDRAQAGLEQDKASRKRKDDREGEPTGTETEFEKRVKAYLDNQRRQAAGSRRNGADQVEERNRTWRDMPLEARAMWLLAYYAEFSGIFEVRPAVAHLCRQCGGTGALESIQGGLSGGPSRPGSRGGVSGMGGPRIEPCPLCHGEQIVRRVRYR